MNKAILKWAARRCRIARLKIGLKFYLFLFLSPKSLSKKVSQDRCVLERRILSKSHVFAPVLKLKAVVWDVVHLHYHT